MNKFTWTLATTMKLGNGYTYREASDWELVPECSLVVLWYHVLGGLYWWETPLSWCGPSLSATLARGRTQTRETKQCCLQ